VGALLDAALLESVLAPFGSSRTLPAVAYLSDDVLAFERAKFFDGSWVCVGRAADLANPGDQRAVTVGTETILLVRDVDAVRAYYDVCPHRGHELLPTGEEAARPIVTCPYHAWSFTLDGTLRGTGRAGAGGADPDGLGLRPVPMVGWHGWLFVNAGADAAPFDDHVGDLDAVVAPYGADGLVAAASSEYEVAANWKLLVENYHECLHCPSIHPELCKVSPPASGRSVDGAGAWVGGPMDLAPHAETMSDDGRSRGEGLAGLDERGRREVQYLQLFPSLLLSLHPDYVLTHRIEPLSPGRSLVRCQWLFPPEAVARPGFDPAYAVDFWDRTNRQDWRACESLQRGVASRGFRPGVLTDREHDVYRFVTMVAAGYLAGS